MDLGLKDKLIVVTGGGAGIGAGISRACLAEGARVVVLGRRSENVLAFMEEMKAVSAHCELVEAHLEDVERCGSSIAEIEERYGDIFGLVNNAGVNDGAGLEKGSVARFVESLNKNLIHYYALAHYALPSLKRTHGAIVNISSKVALTGQGNTLRVCGEQGCTACADAGMGRGAATLQHPCECSFAGGGDDAALQAVVGYAGRSGGGRVEEDYRQDSAGASHDTGVGDCMDDFFCCRKGSLHTRRGSTSVDGGMCIWIVR